jgi:hypothetical protein
MNEDQFKQQDLVNLLKEDTGPCVSIYMPTYRVAASQVREESIRFKNLVSMAENQLAGLERRSETTDQMIGWLRHFQDDENFWKHQRQGLALLCSPSTKQYYRLSMPFTESVNVGHHFYVMPLVATLAQNQTFYVLALSQKHTRLLECNHQSASEVNVDGMPEGVQSLGWDTQREKQRQFRHAGAGASHGQGEDVRQPRADILEFAREVDAAIVKHLRASQAPLVLASAEPTAGHYRQVSTYGHLLERGIASNPDNMAVNELHRQALEIVQQAFPHPAMAEKDRFAQLAETAPTRAVTDPAAIMQAAREGRVETLLYSYGGTEQYAEGFREQLGRDNAKTDVHSDIADAAVRQTLLTAGRAIPADSSDLPRGCNMAAILRY